MIKTLFSLVCTGLFIISAAYAQTGPAERDSIPTYMIDAVVVTADRMSSIIANTTNAVTKVTGAELKRLPVQHLSDVMQTQPGFFVMNKDGIGRQPIVNSRGYFGGGEAEYCLVLVDNKPVNDLETGLINWNLVPLNAISSIEISRGSSSPLYGDAALGSVINVITKQDLQRHSQVSLQAGSYQSYDVNGRTMGTFGSLPYLMYFSNEKTNGYREGSHWRGTTLGGTLSLLKNNTSDIKVSGLNQWTFFNDPGPLTAQEYSQNRAQRSPYYKPDGGPERRTQVEGSYKTQLSEQSELTSGAYYNYKSSSIRRTFVNPIAIVDDSFQPTGEFYDGSQYGDTKERQLSTHDVGINVKYLHSFDFAGLPSTFIAGMDGTLGNALSSYSDVASGLFSDYDTSSSFSTVGQAVASGNTARQKYAFYLSNQLHLADPLTLTLGVRYDALHDAFRGNMPETSMTSNADAFSPKAGLNYRFVDAGSMKGNVYCSWNRSFKAPTIDQRSDQRPIDVRFYKPDWNMFLPYSVSYSNMGLKPQRTSTVEIGTYDKWIISEELSTELALSVYQVDAKDEIDFDLSTYRYGNIGQSRHRGIEAGAKVYWTSNFSLSLNYTLNDVTFQSGSLMGNNLKGIPRDVWAFVVSYGEQQGLSGSIVLNSLQHTYLDDENTSMLANFSTVSAKLSYSIAPLRISVESSNLFDHAYCSTGYILSGTTYLYPAAGRMINGGIEVNF